MIILLLPASKDWEEGQVRFYILKDFENHKHCTNVWFCFNGLQESCLPEMHQVIPEPNHLQTPVFRSEAFVCLPKALQSSLCDVPSINHHHG